MGIEPAQAAVVTQSEIAGTSEGVNFGNLGRMDSTFDRDGLLVMGQYQIGELAAGTVDRHTGRFQILWSHRFAESDVPFLQSGAFSLHGQVQVAPVPVPAALILFGSGLFGIVGVVVRRTTNASALILLVSPDVPFAKEMESQLARSGYDMQVVSSVSDAFPFARQEMPALTLVDQRLSDWDQIRTDKHLHHVPMMILVPTGTCYSENDGILDLERGADGVHLCGDGSRLLVAKVGTYLKRAGYVESKRGLYRVGAVELDSDLQEVKIGTRLVHLSAKPFAILEALVKAPSKVFSRAELTDLVWGPGFAIGDHVLDVHVHALRRLLQQDPDPLCRLVTIKSVGFKLTSLSAAMPASPAPDTLSMAGSPPPLRAIAAPQSTSGRTWLEQVSRQRRTRLLRRKQSIRHLHSIDPFHDSVAASSIHG
jgi:DNA-binding response OmpR family regulator